MISNQHNINDQQKFFHGIGTDIVKEGIFERFPELIPCVGVNYERDGKHKKLLFIGESNYFPVELNLLIEKIERDGDSTLLTPNEIQNLHEFIAVFPDKNKWYKDYTGKPIPQSIKSFVSNDTGYDPFVKTFKMANDILRNHGVEPGGERLYETTFYNYFLRPALDPGSSKAKKFKPEEIDREVAGVALCGIIERLKPQVIVFLSKFSFVAFQQYLNRRDKHYNKISNVDIRYNNVEIHGVVHPSSPWWNRNNGVYGRARLEKILKESWF